MKYLLLDDGFHLTCLINCTESCSESTCDHPKCNFKNNTHFRSIGQTTIEPGSTQLIQIGADSAWEIGKFNTKINHRFHEIMEFIGYNIFGESGNLYVAVQNKNKSTTLFIQHDTIILCGKYGQIALLECNHLTETKNLPPEERMIHDQEFETWLKNCKQLVEDIDISDDIKKTAEQADILKDELHAIMI